MAESYANSVVFFDGTAEIDWTKNFAGLVLFLAKAVQVDNETTAESNPED